MDYCALLMWWSLHNYKYLWGVRGKSWSSNLQKRVTHIFRFTFEKKKKKRWNLDIEEFNFMQSNTSSYYMKEIHWLRWDELTKAKGEGGMGFRDIACSMIPYWQNKLGGFCIIQTPCFIKSSKLTSSQLAQ